MAPTTSQKPVRASVRIAELKEKQAATAPKAPTSKRIKKHKGNVKRAQVHHKVHNSHCQEKEHH
jgi:hypothetical protein